MMQRIPLFTHDSPAAVVAYRGGKALTALQFLADVTRVSALLPAGRHVLNACADRYRFAVGLAACIVCDKISLLPPTQVPEVIRRLREFAPDACCLTDSDACNVGLPIVNFPPDFAPQTVVWDVPLINGYQRVAYVFTSGSSGSPVPHAKTWSRLVGCVRIEAGLLGFAGERRCSLVATVPPQHMYGFESSVLVALQSGQAFCAERPFFPADFVSVLAAVPRPRVLVSTPIHLRALLAAAIDMPALDLVLCATAPLERGIAAAAEARLGAPLIEIYGSTETGQIASRRTTASTEWHLWPGVELVPRDGLTHAQGGHVETPTPLGDIVEIMPGGRFMLHGRIEDLVNIAGKRSSLSFLNHQLMALPGVVDGAFFLREDSPDRSTVGSSRLGALLVAPGVAAETIMRGLRERLDPIFLPRPLLYVDEIPRNSTGKLTKSALRSLTERS
jgi:acyl-coenzyme A synthetase/AMP-(fatty) acid ligase